MTQTLVIYDNDGKIFAEISGGFIIPIGLQHLIVTVPEGKQIVSVDVSGEVHEPIFEDIPPSETQVIRGEVAELNQQLLDVYEMLLLGGI